MVEFDTIIDENIQPFKYSEFREKYARLYTTYETTMMNAGVKIIDIAENLCYNDSCEVLTPHGYAAYSDENHCGKFYARHWLSAVDHLV